MDEVFREVVITGGTASAVVHPEHAERLCAGHFPGNPLLPGAYLAGLMAELGLRLLGPRAEIMEVVRCVFRARVVPDDDIQISAAAHTEGAATTRVEAEVRARGTCAARGTLRFRVAP